MSRYLRTLYTEKDRALVAEWLAKVPLGWRVEIKQPKRSLPQNDKFHAMLTDIATQLTWSDGRRYPPSDWKRYFMREVNKERYMPHEDGGYVPIGRSSTDLSKEEMAFMFDLLEAFGARHGVKFQRQDEQAT
jgi:hypothetical protein